MRKRKSINDYAGSFDADDRFFGRLYPGLMSSEEYKSLSLGARQFYCICRAQAASTQARRCLYNHGKVYERTYPEGCFVFPASHIESFGVGRRNAQKYFKELIRCGFVEIVEANHFQRLPNVYKFSASWKRQSEEGKDNSNTSAPQPP